MKIGHDVVININEKQKSYTYHFLINCIGMNYDKENPNDNSYKNGLRVIQKNCHGIKRWRIRKWAQSRFYFGRQAIVMNIDISNSIFNSLLKTLFDIPGQNARIKSILRDMHSSYGDNSYCFAVLQEIYSIILQDSLNNNDSAAFLSNLKNIEKHYPH